MSHQVLTVPCALLLVLDRSLNVWQVFREDVKGAECCNYKSVNSDRQIKIHDKANKIMKGMTARCDSHVSVIVDIHATTKSGYRRSRLYLHVCSEPAGLESPVVGRAGTIL